MATSKTEIKNYIESAYVESRSIQDKDEASAFLAEQVANIIEQVVKTQIDDHSRGSSAVFVSNGPPENARAMDVWIKIE